MTIKTYAPIKLTQLNKILTKYRYSTQNFDMTAGTVVATEKKGALIHLGLNYTAYLPFEEVSSFFDGKRKNFVKNKFLFNEFLVLKLNTQEKRILISTKILHFNRNWNKIQSLQNQKSIYFSQTYKILKVGQILNTNSFINFIKKSYLPKIYNRPYRKTLYLPFQVLRLKENYNIFLSNSRAVHLKYQVPLIESMKSSKGGTKACITQIRSYGLFLNILGMKSLVRFSDIYMKKSKNLKNLYKRGQEVDVSIAWVNLEDGFFGIIIKK